MDTAPPALIRTSITAKVCVFVAVTEAALLFVLGIVLYRNHVQGSESVLAAKMALPAVLMSQMAMNFEAAADLASLERVIGERVIEAYLARRDGTIFYASEAGRIGTRAPELAGGPGARGLQRTTEAGQRRFSLVTPLTMGGEVVGHFFVAVAAAGTEGQERAVARLLAAGAAITVLLTSLISAFWMRQLLVPRLERTVDALRLAGEGQLSTRIADPGAPDQIGSLVENVNAMIAQIEAHTRNLQTLAEAGGEFANAGSRGELRQTLLKLLQARVGAGSAEALCADVEAGRAGGEEGAETFLRTLGRQYADAAGRIDALGRLQRAEQEYRELFANAVEGIFRLSPDGALEAANASFAAILGVPAADLPARFEEFCRARPDFRAGFAGFLERVRAEGEVHGAELELSREDGTRAWVALSARLLDGGAGRRGVIDGGAVDISERKRREAAESERALIEAEHRAKSAALATIEEKNRLLQHTLEELGRAQARLVQSEKMAAMGTMAAGVAHDLNNILSGIVSYPDLLLQEMPASSPWCESIAVIKESGERAAAVVADLLTISRGAAYVTAPCDLNGLVGKYLRSPECGGLLLRFPGVRVVTRLAADLRPASGSPVHLQKVVMNLVMNACEAIQGSGQVTVSTENVTVGPDGAGTRAVPPGEYALLKVADTGPGIPEKDLATVFEPFFTKKALGHSGTGLGLAVVWNTVTEHGGVVFAESGATGAVLSVYLPVSAGALAEVPPPSRRAGLQGSASILVVDDERMMREVAVKILSLLGHRVEAVASGEEAIACVRAQPFELVVLDMMMPPGLNGCETYREIAKIRPGQKAVICSGFSLSEDFLAAQATGAGGFLKKPYTFEELGLAVKRELERPAGTGARLS
jgi:PAS domain S-box-containing protein